MNYGTVNSIEKDRETFNSSPKIIIPVQSDPQAHWCVNRLSFVYIFNIHTHQELMLGLNHNDLTPIGLENIAPFTEGTTIVFKKKYLWNLPTSRELIDAEMAVWVKSNQKISFDVDPIVKRYWIDFNGVSNMNDFIPIMRHLETCRSIKDSIVPYILDLELTDYFMKYQSILNNLIEIEANGIYVG